MASVAQPSSRRTTTTRIGRKIAIRLMPREAASSAALTTGVPVPTVGALTRARAVAFGAWTTPAPGHAEQDPDPGVVLHPGRAVGLGGGGGGGEDDPAHGGADQGLDGVVD